MSLTTSADVRAALYAPSTDKILIDLVTVEHEDLDAPIRCCNDSVSITSRGNLYPHLRIALALPDDVEGGQPRIPMVFDNVSRELVLKLRGIETPPIVTVETIVASDPDVVELGPFVYQAEEVEIGLWEIRLGLALEALHNEPYPSPIFDPAGFPLIYNAVDR